MQFYQRQMNSTALLQILAEKVVMENEIHCCKVCFLFAHTDFLSVAF